MIELILGSGDITTFDDEDIELLKDYQWYCFINRNEIPHRKYVRGNYWIEGKRYKIFMHRVILGLDKNDKRKVDHIDGNGLNNCRSNLRICTVSQNCHNSKKRLFVEGKPTTSKYKGVYKCVTKQGLVRWGAEIKVRGIRYSLGRYEIEEDAARAYDEISLKLTGEFSNPNNVNNIDINNLIETLLGANDKRIKIIGTSKYRGVSWNKKRKKWVAQIRISNKNTNLGHFNTEIEAAKAYNEAALKYKGKTAKLNVILEGANK